MPSNATLPYGCARRARGAHVVVILHTLSMKVDVIPIPVVAFSLFGAAISS